MVDRDGLVADGSDYGSVRGMDPLANWLLGPGLATYLPDPERTLIPFLIDRPLAELEQAAATIGARLHGFRLASQLSSGPHLIGAVWAEKAFFDALAEPGGPLSWLRDLRKTILLCEPVAGAQPEIAAEPEPPEQPHLGPPPGGWPEGTVVMGVIDDGIAFAHERFRHQDGTSRVECFWHMDGPRHGAARTIEIGRETTRRDSFSGRPGIDTLLRTCRYGDFVDEDRIYAEAGLIRFDRGEGVHNAAAFRVAHGTHVMDLAAGADPREAPRDRPIIAVQLPAAVTADTSGALLDDKLLCAVDYVLDRARRLAGDGPPLPVVINCSYGTFAGPHDGTGLIEAALEERLVMNSATLRLVLPAGNGHLSRCHARIAAGPRATTSELRWRVPPDDRTPTAMEIWLPHADEGGKPVRPTVSVTLVAPNGEVTEPLSDAAPREVEIRHRDQRIGALTFAVSEIGGRRGCFRITLHPTARFEPAGEVPAVAPAGLWTVRLHNLALEEEQPIRAWIQRDDSLHGYPRRGRQSYFDDPCYRRFDDAGRIIEADDPALPATTVPKDGMINALATGPRTIVAGGYRRQDGTLAPYSAGGPITPPIDASGRAKPDAVLVTDDSQVHGGIMAAGPRSGARVALNGTSVAAPQLARWVADAASHPRDACPTNGVLPTRDGIARQAASDDLERHPDGPELDRHRRGAGRLRPLRPRAPARFEDDR